MTGTILVTGGAGRLARAIERSDADAVQALTRQDLDITDADAIGRTLDRLRPAAVINTAATSSVDAAETHPDPAFVVNAMAPGLLAQACARADVPLIHISTDYVFGHGVDRPNREGDTVSPVNAYGRMKAEGERRVHEAGGRACVVRVAWLFGDGEDFISGLLRGPRDRPVAVAADQIGSPTPIDPLARRLVALARRMAALEPGLPPILHLAGTPPVARADWVAAAFDALAGDDAAAPPLVRARMADFPSVAQRPRYSALDVALSARLFGSALDWRPPTAAPKTFAR